MADITDATFTSPGAHIAGFIIGTFAFTLGVVGYYALDIRLTGTILLVLAAIGLVAWLVTAALVGRAR